MKKTRKQHTVPRCYLRGFADSAGKLFAYDKKSDRVYPTNVGDAAQEAYFYDFPAEAFAGQLLDSQVVEKALASIEGRYSPLLSGLIEAAERGWIEHEQIAEFAPYVVLQWMRTKSFRDTTYEIMCKNSQNIVDTLVAANFPEEAGEVRIVIGKEQMAVLHAEEMFDEVRVGKMAAVLEGHFWVVGLNRSTNLFYTSDHPVVRRANIPGEGMMGANKKGAEYVFPLSCRHVLLIMERTHFASWRKYDNRTVELSDEQIADYNRLQVMRSAQRVYCQVNHFDLARRTCEENPIVRDPDRPRIKVESTPIKDLTNFVFTTALE